MPNSAQIASDNRELLNFMILLSAFQGAGPGREGGKRTISNAGGRIAGAQIDAIRADAHITGAQIDAILANARASIGAGVWINHAARRIRCGWWREAGSGGR